MTINTVIIEDEKNSAELLESIINDYCPNVEVGGIASSVEDGLTLIETSQPDIVFLDVDIINGTGFDILDKSKFLDFKIVMTTAHEKYAMKAFKYDVSEYLLKPYSPLDIINAVNKLRDKILEERLFSNILSSKKVSGQEEIKKIALPTSKGVSIFEVDKIVRLESDNTYTTISILDQKKTVLSKTMKYIESLLPSRKFYRVHDSHVINLDLVKEFNKEDCTVLLSNGESIPVAKRRKQEFLDIISKS
jgi:two-component system, LytTR family, response regulator